MEICFATNNHNKIEEIDSLLTGDFQVKTMGELGINDDIEETGSTMEENSEIKASFIYKKLGITTFADDSGLEVLALDNAPGVYSARYAGEHGNHVKNNQLLLKNMEGIKDRRARFRCVITLIRDGHTIQFEGIIDGTLREELSGSKGFGYDPLFVPDGFDRTFAEMDLREKTQMSHRGRAFEKLATYLNE